MIAKFIKINKQLVREFGTSSRGVTVTKKEAYYPFKATIIARNKEICQIEGIQNEDNYELKHKFEDEVITIRINRKSVNVKALFELAKATAESVNEKSFQPFVDHIMPEGYDENGNEIITFGRNLVTVEKVTDNYYHNIIRFRNEAYNVYDVSDFKEGMFLCVYNSKEELVGTIKKIGKVKNFKDNYDIYCKDSQYEKLMCIVASCWHQFKYEKYNDDVNTKSGGYSVSGNTVSSLLRAKYNPNYINEVIASEPTEYQLENMPLVNEKIQESHNAKDTKMAKRGLIIVLALFALLALLTFLI